MDKLIEALAARPLVLWRRRANEGDVTTLQGLPWDAGFFVGDAACKTRSTGDP
jgi:hypothetical protein